jgi:low affinity Fe/Cu permease
MHAKLDELIHATKRARDEMAGIEEELDEKEIRELREEAKELVEAAAERTNDIADGERQARHRASRRRAVAATGRRPFAASTIPC